MATQIDERENGTFLSQTVANPKDPRSTPSNLAQVNAIHTLQSGKEVNIQVVMPDKTASAHPNVVSSSPGSNKSEEKEAEQH